MTTDNPIPAPHRALAFVQSKLLWLTVATTAAFAWAYRRVAGSPKPLTRTEEKQRRKALARTASTSSRRQR